MQPTECRGGMHRTSVWTVDSAVARPDPRSLDLRPASREFVARAIDGANLNVLRIALFHATGDPALANMTVTTVKLRGGAFVGYNLDEAHHAELKAKAVAFMRDRRRQTEVRRSDSELRSMMEMFTGEPLSDTEARLGREELALDEFPREATWSSGRPLTGSAMRVLIVGAGWSGVTAAIQLERLGIPYFVVERQEAIGGTWHLNHYPDARVDTNNFLYQFRFEKRYPWPEFFSSQNEVKKYLEHMARKYKVFEKIRFRTEVTRAVFNEASQTWSVDAEVLGQRTHFEANIIISAAGMFSTPKFPNIPGIGSFRGRSFHTTAWDDNYDPAGQRIATIGNGSTGVQVMPKLAESAGQVYAFQRTPQWISPMEGYRNRISAETRWLLDTFPYYYNWFCFNAHVTATSLQRAQTYDPDWRRAGGSISEANDGLRASLTDYIRGKLGNDSYLFKKSLPNYAPLARRLVVDNGWYDALLKDNVELVTDGIDHITSNAIVTATGREIEVDAIVFAAGFDTTKYLWPTEYVGRHGQTMEQAWQKDGPRAYYGMCVPKFPNLFICYGPSSQPRAGSFITSIENWVRYIGQAIVLMVEGDIKSLEVKGDVFERYNIALDRKNQELIWESEGPTERNYYVNEHGRQIANSPWLIDEYYQMIVAPNLDDFEIC